MAARSPSILVLWIGWLALIAPSALAADNPVSFKRELAPILVSQCLACHGAEKVKGGYRLDTVERMLTAGESKKPPVTAGEPAKSNLLALLVAPNEDDRMPQKADALPAAQVELFKRWIEQGATIDPSDRALALAELAQPEQHPAPPAVYPRPFPVTAVAFSPDGRYLAAAGYHEVTLWDPATGRLLGRIQRLPQRTLSIAFSPDGALLAAAGGTPGALGELRLIALPKPFSPGSAGAERLPAGEAPIAFPSNAIEIAPGKSLLRISDVLFAVQFSPDGKTLAAGGADNAVHLFDVASGRRTKVVELHADWVTDLAFSPDGSQIATASRDKSARVFDVKDGHPRAAFLAHEEPLTAVAWDPSGASVFSAGRDKKVRAWTILASSPEPKPGPAISISDADPLKLFIAPSAGSSVFVALSNGQTRQYEPPTVSKEPKASAGKAKDSNAKGDSAKPNLLRTFPATSDCAYALAYDAKSRRLAVSGQDGTIRIFDVTTGQPIGSFVAAPGYRGPEKP